MKILLHLVLWQVAMMAFVILALILSFLGGTLATILSTLIIGVVCYPLEKGIFNGRN